MSYNLNKYIFYTCLSTILLIISSCNHSTKKTPDKTLRPKQAVLKNTSYSNSTAKLIHVLVALCDNKYQGIIPVPAKLGNGQELANNLYWGGSYGVRTYFEKSNEWKLIKTLKPGKPILERLIFKHSVKNCYLVADAYDGQYIKQTINDFLFSCSGQLKDTLHIGGKVIGINGNAGLIAYVGHDGLMNFHITNSIKNIDGNKRNCIILACVSKTYFAQSIKASNSYPLVWTTGLMCPEAYTLHDAISGYVNNESHEQIRLRAVWAYNKYQKFGLEASNKLLVSGW